MATLGIIATIRENLKEMEAIQQDYIKEMEAIQQDCIIRLREIREKLIEQAIKEGWTKSEIEARLHKIETMPKRDPNPDHERP